MDILFLVQMLPPFLLATLVFQKTQAAANYYACPDDAHAKT